MESLLSLYTTPGSTEDGKDEESEEAMPFLERLTSSLSSDDSAPLILVVHVEDSTD
jgi:hypothetical protein